MTRYVYLDCAVRALSDATVYVDLGIKKYAAIPRADIDPGCAVEIGKPLMVTEDRKALALEAAGKARRRT